jgi:hypothetical protein
MSEQTKRLNVTKKQILEWRDNPVTVELKWIVLREIAIAKEAMQNAYHPFDPQRTQEIMAALNANEQDWLDFQDLVEGRWEVFTEEDNEPSSAVDEEELFGDLPGGEQDTGET